MNQIITKQGELVREIEEAFHHISLDVKTNKTIHDALKYSVSGETIEGYYYEKEQKTVGEG